MMTIPEISPLFLISMCGLSVVCIGIFGVVAFMILRFTSGELFEFAGELFNRGEGDEGSGSGSSPSAQPAARRDLRARAQSFDFDSAIGGNAQSAPPANPGRYGENSSLRPDGGRRLNPDKADLDLRPPGPMSDNPDALYAPPPPNFNPGSEYLPNTNSNVGDRVGRHNTGRDQSGQRLDSSRFRDVSENNNMSTPGSLRRRSSGNAARDDERFGGMYDLDGDGDVDV
ncbi:MAG: hypothetical protein AAF787_02110 [Chloroflexota bacterium]